MREVSFLEETFTTILSNQGQPSKPVKKSETLNLIEAWCFYGCGFCSIAQFFLFWTLLLMCYLEEIAVFQISIIFNFILIIECYVCEGWEIKYK